MKQVKLFLAIAALSIGTLSITSCGSDEQICPTGMEGKDCKDEVRVNYYNTYRGTGTDNQGGTYTNWGLKYSKNGEVATKLSLEVVDGSNANVYLLDVELNSNTTYKVVPKTQDGFELSGQGSISPTNASLTLTEKDPSGVEVTYVYSFTDFIKG